MKASHPILLSLLLLTGAVRSQKMIPVRPGQPLVVAGNLETFADSTQQLRVAQINALYKARQFTRLPGNRLLKNYTTANHWLHLRLPPASGQWRYLEIDNPRIDQVRFYQLVGGHVIRQVVTGNPPTCL